MSEFMQRLLDPDELKIRWEEPYVSAALNRKLLPQGKGIFRGFIPVVNGNVVELHLDSVANDSVGVVETQNHYSVLIYLTRQVDFDFTGHGIFPVWIVLEATYDINTPTTGRILVVDGAQLKPWHTRICKIDSGLVIDLNERDEFLKFSTANPAPVGAASSPGTMNELPRRDHVHEGVHKIIAGSNVSVTPANGLGDVTIDVTLPPSGTPGHIIQDEGVDLFQRPKLNFIGQVITVQDDPGNNATKVIVGTGVPQTLFAGGSNVPGTSQFVAAADHVHAIAADGLPNSVGSVNSGGVSSVLARIDHVHAGVHKILAGTNITINPESGLGDVRVSATASRMVFFGTSGFVKLMGNYATSDGLPFPELDRVMRGRYYNTRYRNAQPGRSEENGTDMDGIGLHSQIFGYDATEGFYGDDGLVYVPNEATGVILRVYAHQVQGPEEGGVYFFMPGKQRPMAFVVSSITEFDEVIGISNTVMVPLASDGRLIIRTYRCYAAWIWIIGYII